MIDMKKDGQRKINRKKERQTKREKDSEIIVKYKERKRQ